MALETHEWTVEGPKILDIGDEGERVSRLKVVVIGGRIDVVTHDDSPTARVEIVSVEGPEPVKVRWDGTQLGITHGSEGIRSFADLFKRLGIDRDERRVVASISVPPDTTVDVSAISAAVLLSGLSGAVKANTVSGETTLAGIHAPMKINTVSGNAWCSDVSGPLDVNTVSGEVVAQQSAVAELRANTVSGTISMDLTATPASVVFNTVSGDVTLRVPMLGGYDVKAHSVSGKVVVDGRRLVGEPGGSGGHLRSGDGSLMLKAHSVSGNVTVLSGSKPASPEPAADDPTPQAQS